MRAIMLICLAIAMTVPGHAATLYRWVDDNGRVHYSDRPQPGADTVEVSPAQSYQPPPAAPRRPSRQRSEPQPENAPEPAPGYASIAVSSPTQDQVLWNIGAVLPVTVVLQPALQPTHRLVVRYNGAPVPDWPGNATSHQVSDVFRGTHTISAEVVDASGKVLASTTPVTFHVKQTSILLN